ncbi:ATP-dependent DNA ligase [Plantibacter sp. Leaf314]|uniref:ATP-dependent DNA ligase n=1 Tax=Plantibacter sp. Leaf314 TaxID=1736333 RepID=UPI0006F3EB46|nr:ATP-dependent DNA ligase [Plantibacter sp. Leaf314]KQQ51006.1 ATP-dependent DNA ligase [Plantibacter sp. Leaf314]
MARTSSGGARAQWVTVDGRRIQLTHLDKVLYPATGTTKAEVLAYYAAVAPHLLPHVADRPVTRKRWVHGVGTAEAPESGFFQKDLGASAPDWVQRLPIEHSDHTNEYPVVDDLATLTWLAQLGALELHVPQWRFDRSGERRPPDRLVLDLDPGEGVSFAECAGVARMARAVLVDMGLEPVPVTSGSKGIHLYAALDGRQRSDEVSLVAHELARALAADAPTLVVSEMAKDRRRGKVFVDWSQNNGSKTTIAPFSLRGRLRPTVAAPRSWDELDDPELSQLEFPEVLERLADGVDPLSVLGDPRPSITIRPSEHEDRLSEYRRKRDASRTPEPVPEASPPSSAAGTAPSFVIQRHEARKLHHDFRLEHDGVLVSWALPKGVPTDPSSNRLAVRTEDHPLEYGSFEGTIPAGEYGAGEVTIWDAGTYELEKWRDDEVIATLHGRAGGPLERPARFALIRTAGDSGRDAPSWLIHRMRAPGDPPAPPVARSREVPAPMLASPAALGEVVDDGSWAFEMKWDGIRAIASIDGATGRVRLSSRNGKDLTAAYPEVVEELGASFGDRDVVLDGEIVASGADGRPDFSLLQRRMQLTSDRDVDRERRLTPVRLLVFDLLALDDEDRTGLPYRERRELLEETVGSGAVVQVPPRIDGSLHDALEVSRALRLEGVVAKELDGRYRPGRRSSTWMKFKHERAEEVVVAGWRPGRGGRTGGIGSLLLGVPGPDGLLHYAGRVGSGFTDRELAATAVRFERLARSSTSLLGVPPADAADANWLDPVLIGEVRFSEWTPDGRFRHPVWRGWRPDRAVDDLEVPDRGR